MRARRVLAGITVLALSYGMGAQAGPADSPLPIFSDGKAALHLYTVVGVIKKSDLETVFICTNLDTVAVNIGVEVFDRDGVLRNSIAAGNGEVLNVVPGATRTIVTSGTVLLADDKRITGLPELRNGSGRVVATSGAISCSAMVVDQLRAIVDPQICPTCELVAPPLVVHLPLIRVSSLGLGGMFDTPLPTFSDGKGAQVVGLLPRVIKKDNLETVVICTNLGTAAANIGLEVFDKDGVLANSIAAGNGEILNVAVGATRTIGTSGTRLLTEDHRMTMLGALDNGSGRVVASERNVFCVGMLVDEIHEILRPSECAFCPPPTLVNAPIWACGNSVLDPLEQCDDGNLVGGDGCEADCTTASSPGCGNGIVNLPGETCDPPGSTAGGNGGLCRGDCTVCGDAVVDAGEVCDDGNGIDGDGCESDCQLTGGQSQPQDPDQQKCINALNTSMLKVASKQGKDICACIKDGAKGRLSEPISPIESCLSADRSGNVAKAQAGTSSAFNKSCTASLPDFGVTDPTTVDNAAVEAELDLIHIIFGPDLDAVIASEIPDKNESKCQQKIARSAKKCLETKLKEYNRCKKLALGNPIDPAALPADLEACVFADPKGKVAKFCGRSISKQVQKKCVLKDVNLAAAFPGIGVAGASALENALGQTTGCLACRALNTADALNRDCDDADDGIVNGSCP